MNRNIPVGYSEDGDAPSHGHHTAIYQDLDKIRASYSKWFFDNKRTHQFYNDEQIAQAESVLEQLRTICDDLCTPL